MIKVTKDMKALEIFNNVCDETIEIILEQGEIRKYSKDTIVFYDKEEVTDIYIVISGTVSLYKLNENGQKKVIFILGEGKVVNEVIIFLHSSKSYFIISRSLFLLIFKSSAFSKALQFIDAGSSFIITSFTTFPSPKINITFFCPFSFSL